MKLCIFGASGQVGSQLVMLCQERSIKHVAVTRSQLDVTNASAVKAFFSDNHDFDCVINATAYTNVDGAERDPSAADAVNHLAVQHMAKVCQQYGMPLMHLSTDYVFDGTQKEGYQASDHMAPLGAYGRSKVKGELAVQGICDQYIILRLSWVYSAVGNNFLKTMLKLMQTKDEIRVINDQYGAPTSAVSIARAIVTVCEHQCKHADTAPQRWGIYHYSDGPVTTWYDYACYIHQQAMAMGFPVKTKAMIAIPSEAYETLAKRPQYSIFCLDKIVSAFGVKPGNWQQEVDKVLRTLMHINEGCES